MVVTSNQSWVILVPPVHSVLTGVPHQGPHPLPNQLLHAAHICTRTESALLASCCTCQHVLELTSRRMHKWVIKRHMDGYHWVFDQVAKCASHSRQARTHGNPHTTPLLSDIKITCSAVPAMQFHALWWTGKGAQAYPQSQHWRQLHQQSCRWRGPALALAVAPQRLPAQSQCPHRLGRSPSPAQPSSEFST